MEIKKSLQSMLVQLKKYRHAALVVIIGLALMVLPSYGGSKEAVETTCETVATVPSLEQKLTETLSHLQGAGEVHVMLSVAKGEQILYQTDTDSTGSTQTQNHRETTVTVSDADRNETGLIQQIIPTQYQGVIVLCSGADDPSVRLAVVDAVSKVTGLGANHISVLKMK